MEIGTYLFLLLTSIKFTLFSQNSTKTQLNERIHNKQQQSAEIIQLMHFYFNPKFNFCETDQQEVYGVWLYSDQMPRHHPVLNKGSSEWPGFNATNILRTAFMRTDPKSANTVKPSVFFTLLWSACVKATCKMVVKLTQFIQKCYLQLFCTYNLCLYLFGDRKRQKPGRKMLVKLRPTRRVAIGVV